MVITGFYDLNVIDPDKKDVFEEILTRLNQMGYTNIAINTTIEQSTFTSAKKLKNAPQSSDYIPEPRPVNDRLKSRELLSKMNVYQRITIKVDDASIIGKLNQSTNLRKYDLIAVIPTNQAAFALACSTLDVDLISFDAQERSQLKINRKLYNQAVNRGLFFELSYAPAIRDSDQRKNIFYLASIYNTAGKLNNVVLSSSANDPWLIRGPYDVINLSHLFGLNESRGHDTVVGNCKSLLLHARGRKMARSVVVIRPIHAETTELKRKNDEESLKTDKITCLNVKKMKI